MKSFSFIATALVAVFVAFATSSCTNEEQIKGVQANEDNGPALYVTFSVSMATATRSTTGDTDEEVGQSEENTVSSVLLVLTDTADKDAQVIATTTIATTNNDGTDGNLSATSATQYVGKLGSEDIAAALGTQVYVWVVCNPGTYTVNSLVEDMFTLSSLAALPSAEDAFLMTNAQTHTVVLPEASAFTQYSETNPFNMGNVYVERAVARFDFKDGTTEDTPYTYTLSDSEATAYYTDGLDNALDVTVTISDLALINQSNAFYYFRRVSADGTMTDAVIGGTETVSNYVVDTDPTFKSGSDEAIVVDSSDNFFEYLGDGVDAWTFTSVEDIAEGFSDSWDGSYNFWCYAPENTIPQDADGADSYQRHHVSTGVVFKGVLDITPAAVEDENGDPTPLAAAMEAGETIWVYNGNIWFGSWEDVVASAEAYDLTGVVEEIEAAIAALGENPAQYLIDEVYESQGFNWVDYDTEEDAYVTYYYYWNYHNDNGDNELMGPMEFAVVRNNVYKLQVTDITGLGRTPVPGPDETPSDLNIVVDVTILPWVVRQNDIVF